MTGDPTGVAIRGVLRVATALAGTWCAASITVYRPAIARALPGDTWAWIPAAWATLVAAAFVARVAREGLPAGAASSMAAIGLFALATIPTSLLQTEDRGPEWTTRIVLVSGQIFCLAVALPALFRRVDFERTLAILGAVFFAASLFIWAINVLGVSRVLGEDLPRMNERGGPLRWGIVFHRNPNSFIFQWMPAVLLYAALRTSGAWRIVAAGAAILVFAQMMVSFSRGTTVTVLLSLAPAGWWLLRYRRAAFAIGLVAVAVALVAAVRVSPAVRSYLALGLNLMHREDLWREHLRHLWESGGLLWGTGYFNSWVRGWWGPHNAYLAVLIFYGLLGAAAYLRILVVEGRAVRLALTRCGRPLRIRLLAALLVATLAWGLVEDGLSGPLTMPAFYFWLLVGMLKRCGEEEAAD